ncbi:MAG: hypothetical protein II008_02965 [Oscillospiraceae bacterium]|nr:hypothetical protein [Oscillospiraceae bacterium]
MQNRFRSWALWLSVAALVVYVIKMIWGLDVSEQVNGFLDVLLPVLVAFGIVNNPTDREHF